MALSQSQTTRRIIIRTHRKRKEPKKKTTATTTNYGKNKRIFALSHFTRTYLVFRWISAAPTKCCEVKVAVTLVKYTKYFRKLLSLPDRIYFLLFFFSARCFSFSNKVIASIPDTHTHKLTVYVYIQIIHQGFDVFLLSFFLLLSFFQRCVFYLYFNYKSFRFLVRLLRKSVVMKIFHDISCCSSVLCCFVSSVWFFFLDHRCFTLVHRWITTKFCNHGRKQTFIHWKREQKNT